MNIGEAVKQIRRIKGLNQKDYAKKIGITQSYLCQIEQGHRKPSTRILEDIARVMDLPLPVLLWYALEKDDMKAEKRESFLILKPAMDGIIGELI